MLFASKGVLMHRFANDDQSMSSWWQYKYPCQWAK